MQTDSNGTQLAEACSRIKTAIQNNSKRLDLSNLGLSTLPKRVLNRLPELTHLNLNGNPLDTLPEELKDLKHLTHLQMDLGPRRLAFIPTALKDWWKTYTFKSLNGTPNTTLLAVHGDVKDNGQLVLEIYAELLAKTTLPTDLQIHPSYTAFFDAFDHRMQKEHAKQVAHLLEYGNQFGQSSNQFVKRLGVLFTEHFEADLLEYSSTQPDRHKPGLMRRVGVQTQQTQVEAFAKTMVKEVKRVLSDPESIPAEVLEQKHRTLLYPIVLAQYVFDRVIERQPKAQGSGKQAA
jgi:Leucine rich repeat